MSSNGTIPNNRKINQATCPEFAKNIIKLSKAWGPGAGGRINLIALKSLLQKCVTFVLSCSFIKTCSLTEQVVNTRFCSRRKVLYRNNRFQESCNVKYFKERKRLKSLQKAEAYLEPKQGSTWSFLWIYFKAYYFRNKNSIIDVRLGYT